MRVYHSYNERGLEGNKVSGGEKKKQEKKKKNKKKRVIFEEKNFLVN